MERYIHTCFRNKKAWGILVLVYLIVMLLWAGNFKRPQVWKMNKDPSVVFDEEEEELVQSMSGSLGELVGLEDGQQRISAESTDIPSVCYDSPKFLVSGELKGTPLLLSSFPGSGNTWIRHVAQEGTRLLTGSMYNDISLKSKFPGEGSCDDTVPLVKTHFPCRGCWKNRKTGAVMPVKKTGDLPGASGTVYLIRNPFDTLLAEFNRRKANNSHTGSVERDVFQGKDWSSFIDQFASSYVEHVQYFMNKPMSERMWRDVKGRPTYVVYYENFVNDFEREVVIMLDSIRGHFTSGNAIIPSNSDALACIRLDQQGSFKRSSKNRFNPFRPDQIQKICRLSKQVWQGNVWGVCDGKLLWEK